MQPPACMYNVQCACVRTQLVERSILLKSKIVKILGRTSAVVGNPLSSLLLYELTSTTTHCSTVYSARQQHWYSTTTSSSSSINNVVRQWHYYEGRLNTCLFKKVLNLFLITLLTVGLLLYKNR